MTGSIWRFAHLTLALFSCAFLLVASVTGIILAIDVIGEKNSDYQIENFEEINLAQSITGLRKVYPEILELTVDHNNFVTVEGFNENGEDFKSFVNPLTGHILGQPQEKSEFIQWVTSLHRSLFLHETGRFIVGIVSFLLLLIVISGAVLIIKRQQGIRHFFAKIHKDFFAQYFHVVSGRILLIPILLIALTGTYLFLLRFEVISKQENREITYETSSGKEIPLIEFPVFKEMKLVEIQKIEFPFSDDPEEVYKIKTSEKEIIVNQITGQIISESVYSKAVAFEQLSLDIHTGRTNVIWAIILSIASLNIIFFIYSGFAITLKRKGTKIKNKFKASEAEIIILVGSENGSTTNYANSVHKQLLGLGKKTFMVPLNQYQLFPEAKQLLIFTSTYGLGDAPSNANQFKKLVEKTPQNQTINFSVIGFGSRNYEDFCGYAYEIDTFLGEQSWAIKQMDVHTVNDKSTEDLLNFIESFNEFSDVKLPTVNAVYSQKAPKLKKIKVIANSMESVENEVFELTLKASQKNFQSGDLLAIYPENDARERLYSIAKINGNIKLVVKKHEFGLGSQYLSRVRSNDIISGRIIKNESFHFPKQVSSVILIANGTGIAPYLGMIEENKNRVEVYLFAGFRFRNGTSLAYEKFANNAQKQNKLKRYHFAYSREEKSSYVMNLIENDAQLFAKKLSEKGVIMICGSLAMQKDVEVILNKICLEINEKPLSFYKENKQVLTDCY